MKTIYLAMITLLMGTPSAWPDDNAPIQVTTFSTDITTPVGQPVGEGFIPVMEQVEHPLLARGVLLRYDGKTYALCTLDWMEVHNESYDMLRTNNQ